MTSEFGDLGSQRVLGPQLTVAAVSENTQQQAGAPAGTQERNWGVTAEGAEMKWGVTAVSAVCPVPGC